MTRTALCLGLVLATLAVSCAEAEATRRPRTGARRKTTDPATGKELPDFNDPRTIEKEGLPDPLEGLLRGNAQNEALCARVGSLETTNPNINAVTNALCKEKSTITSLNELLTA